MTENLIITLAVTLAFFGLLMVLFPHMVDCLERALNRPVGGRPVVNLRAGIPGERCVEEILNRPVLGRAIYWDHWVRRQPRAFGIALLAAAAVCVALVAA